MPDLFLGPLERLPAESLNLLYENDAPSTSSLTFRVCLKVLLGHGLNLSASRTTIAAAAAARRNRRLGHRRSRRCRAGARRSAGRALRTRRRQRSGGVGHRPPSESHRGCLAGASVDRAYVRFCSFVPLFLFSSFRLPVLTLGNSRTNAEK